MKGLSEETAKVFESIKVLDILNDYLLIGGTALSMQIEHRLSEDLDFCKWQDIGHFLKPTGINMAIRGGTFMLIIILVIVFCFIKF